MGSIFTIFSVTLTFSQYELGYNFAVSNSIKQITDDTYNHNALYDCITNEL